MTVQSKTLFVALAFSLFAAAASSPSDFIQKADTNHDGYLTRDELRASMTAWLNGKPSATQDELESALQIALPESVFMGMISPPQSRTPNPADVEKMMAALPSAAPAKPAKPRQVLVLSKCAGFVHSSIPLAGKTMEELGAKTGAWTATVSYDASVINAKNLKHYDAVFLNSTTGFFLDEPGDPAATKARRQALLDFVRSGKGLAGIHAAGDSYHESSTGPEITHMMAAGIVSSADKNNDKSVDAAELTALADKWFDTIDTTKSGKVSEKDFRAGFPRALFSTLMPRGPARLPGGRPGPDPQVGTWPEFNTMIGGFFKFHWLDPQHIVYKIDDPSSPLTAMFRDGFEINDETYTFSMKTWSRRNLHVLTSIDYAKMSDADKAKEDYPRLDHDYGLSWIRREGKGRVFYMAHGHSEHTYASRPMLEHLLAGVQYAIGDLKADDSPSDVK